ncbi:MAG TPA: helix-turn-helix domain-containing protein [Candidatus Saccharimonadales bacterium]|nr:helix-turn-helix domain-containing protein [Candidatus Saccharimonadales bacterium]
MQATSEFSQVELGQRLREARRSAQLTLQQLSRLSGYSVTHLSQVERGHACPTIGALRRITGAIGRDIKSFLESSPLPDASLVRRGDRRKLELESPRLQVELATSRVPGGELQAAVHVVRSAAAREAATPSVASYPRYFYILKGRLELMLDGKMIACEPGTAVHVSARTAMSYRNPDRDPCEMLVVSLGSAV